MLADGPLVGWQLVLPISPFEVGERSELLEHGGGIDLSQVRIVDVPQGIHDQDALIVWDEGDVFDPHVAIWGDAAADLEAMVIGKASCRLDVGQVASMERVKGAIDQAHLSDIAREVLGAKNQFRYLN